MATTIGDILLKSGVITAAQLNQCLEEIKTSKVPLEQCLVTTGQVSPVAIAKTFADYAGIAFVENITDTMTDLDILGKVPFKFLRDNIVMPVVINKKIVILTANPLNFQPLDEINMLLGGEAEYAVSTAQTIINGINRYYPLEGTKQMIQELEEEEKAEAVDFEEVEEKDILGMATEAPIIKLVNHILFQAVKRGASDIHIEPFEKEVHVRYRIDGIMYETMTPPKRIQSALTSRIKIMAHLDIAEKRIPQDGRIAIKVADKAIDLRVSILPVSFGERIVMRLLDKSRTFSQIEDLGLCERDYKIMIKTIQRPNGIFYVTGPTGSGKTSTLYSILGRLNQSDVNIITVEDPVEYQMSGIGQVQVREKVGLTFAAALRSILRQDPDIVMIGETRDLETAQIAIQAALTGHFVLSTLHTNNAPAAITRLLDMGIEPFLIASSVVAILAQRLVRKLCHCKRIYKPVPDLLARIGITQQEANTITFYEPVGCPDCSETGYKGRRAVFEIMEMTPAIAQLTMQRSDATVIRTQATKDGMQLLLNDGIRIIKEGITTIDEVLAVATIEQQDIEV
jgi:general secretion pathway protein E